MRTAAIARRWIGFLALAAVCGMSNAQQVSEPHDSQDPGAGPHSPMEALSGIKLPSGFRATLFAAEPDVRQPIHISTDERGRLWVCENYTYAELSVNFEMKYRDRIVIFEDVDGDGVHDRRTVFWDQGQRLTSAVVGHGGVWALCAPQLIFIPDRDRDDRPDGPPEVVLDGWDADAVRHNIVNGLKWGPDGWLYGMHGILATSLVGPPAAAASQRTPINCGIWRYHPQSKRFEVVARGTTNPWGMDYDEHGQMFMINTVIGHLWHVVPGAYWERMYGAHANTHLYELIDQCADHHHWDTKEDWFQVREGISDSTLKAGGGHAHVGMMIYLGDNWPSEYRNGVFTVNIHGRRLNHDRLQRRGSGYVARHEADLCFFDDPWFRGMELVYGADGGVYLADWSDTGECHENDGVHRSSGRIYKIMYQPDDSRAANELKAAVSRDTADAPATGDDNHHRLDLARLNNLELALLQRHENEWHVRHARRILQERAATFSSESKETELDKLGPTAVRDMGAAVSELQATFAEDGDVRLRLRALWCLHALGHASPRWLAQSLRDPEPHVRLWAVRLLADQPPQQLTSHLDDLVDLAGRESEPLVQHYLASAMGRLPLEQRWTLAAGLAVRLAPPSEDDLLARMIWYGLEPAVVDAPEKALALALASGSGKLSRFLTRRVTSMRAASDQPCDDVVQAIARADSSHRRRDMLQGMVQAMQGRRQAPRPQEWTGLARQMETADDAETVRLVQELSVVFGDGRAIAQMRTLALTAAADPSARIDALETYARSRPDDLFVVLKQVLDDRILRETAVAELAACDSAEVAPLVLARYGQLSSAGRAVALDTLCARAAWAMELLDYVERQVIPREDITAWHARQIMNHQDAELTARLRRAWGEIREASEDRRQEIAQLETSMTPELLSQSNLERGRELFRQNCANCHVLYGEGGRAGPDLTGANRSNLRYLLENIVDPSASVVADFRASIVRLQDGRALSGVVLARGDGQVLLQTKDRQETLAEADIEEIQATTLSLMPDGLLTTLEETAIRDLLGYIMARR